MRNIPSRFSTQSILRIVSVLILIGVAGYYIVQNSSQTRVKISTNGSSFSFDMGVPAKKVARHDAQGNSEFYQVKLPEYNANIIATAYKAQTPIKGDFSCPFSSFKAKINGAQHTVCSQKDIAYVANFSSNGNWFQTTVFSEGLKTTLKHDTVTQILESLEVE
jgi:hypothetical protein